MIGFVHGLLVRVDILLVYALLGFVLVLMYKWPTKLLVGITLFLFLGGASLIPVAYKAVTAPAVEQVVERQALELILSQNIIKLQTTDNQV